MKRKNVPYIVGTVGIVLASLGLSTTAFAGNNQGGGVDPDEKPWICHPVNGKGETKTGWNKISPDKSSSHIYESLYPGGHYWKHESNDGRHDQYANADGSCGAVVETESPSPSTSSTPTVIPTHTSTSPTPTVTPTIPSGDDPSETVTVTPSVTPSTQTTVTPSVTPSTTVVTSTPTPTPPADDPVVSQDVSTTPTKTTVTQHHKSGKTTVTVTHYSSDVTEEGF